jgi:hypothetical protein
MSHLNWGRSLVVSLAALGTLCSAQAMAAALKPHRAVYDFEIGRNERNSGYTAAEGRLAYEITGSKCEGWSISYRFASRYVQSEGSIQLSDTQMTSWEAGDGSELRINQKQYYDNALSSESKIIVKRETPESVAKGEVTVPAPKQFELSAETLFPIMSQAKLIDVAAAGETRYTGQVFEGTDSEKPYRVVSLIAKKKTDSVHSADAKSAEAAPLKTLPSWSFTTSYYPSVDDGTDQPIYESHYTMHENGVATDLMFDYGSYTLKGSLNKLVMLDEQACE